MRDQDHVFHVESFVVQKDGTPPSLGEAERASMPRSGRIGRVQNMVMVLADEYQPGHTTGDATALGGAGEK